MDPKPAITRDSEIKLFLVLSAALLFMLIVSFFLGLKVNKNEKPVSTETASQPFPVPAIEAKAVYVYDARTQSVLFAKNENTRLPLASLAKIMAALVAEDLSSLSHTVTITNEALRAEGDSGLYRGEKWATKDILDFSLITSSNDGIRAMALSLDAFARTDATSEEIINDFVRKMNNKARILGLKNTYFWNETGLDVPAQADGLIMKGGAYGTAKDMGALLEYILLSHSEMLEATKDTLATFQSLDNHLHVAKNTNSMTDEIPGLLASKTGFTDTAGGNLAIVFDPELGRPIIIAILGSTEEGRFKDARMLVRAVMTYIKNN